MVRQRGLNDCMIAAFATACGLTYEATASAFGYPCAPQSAAPIPVFKGIDALEVIFPLSELGFAVTLVITAEGLTNPGLSLPSSNRLKQALRGCKAVLCVPDPILMVRSIQHALAWDGEHASDCRSGEVVNLENLALSGAMFIDRRISAGEV